MSGSKSRSRYIEQGDYNQEGAVNLGSYCHEDVVNQVAVVDERHSEKRQRRLT